NTERRFRMEEGDPLAGGAFEGLLVDEADAGAGRLAELPVDVVRRERDVVNAARWVLLEELRDRAFRARGFEQLEVDVAAAEERGAHPLGGNFLDVLALQAQGLLIVGHGLVEGPHRDSEVIDFLEHDSQRLDGWSGV